MTRPAPSSSTIVIFDERRELPPRRPTDLLHHILCHGHVLHSLSMATIVEGLSCRRRPADSALARPKLYLNSKALCVSLSLTADTVASNKGQFHGHVLFESFAHLSIGG